MSALSEHRDYCRHMATAAHTPECKLRDAKHRRRRLAYRALGGPPPGPRPECGGCVTDADRRLWGRLADEIDAWIENGLADDDPHQEAL